MKTSYFTSLPLLGLMLLSGCSGQGDPPASRVSANRLEPVKVTVARAEERMLDRRVEIVGTLLTEDEVVVSSQVEGVIDRIDVDLGDAMHQGDVLGQIDQRDFQLRLQEAEAALKQVRARLGLTNGRETIAPQETTIRRQAKATYDEAKLRYQRIGRLREAGIVSGDDLDRAQSAYLVAEARYQASLEEVRTLLARLDERRAAVAMARRELEKTVIRAPVTGGVTVRHVSAGERLKVNESIVTLVKLNPLWLRADVPERYAAAIRIGRGLTFTIDALPDETFRGHLGRISPSVNPETRSLTIEAEIDNRERKLKPGYFARAEIVVQPTSTAIMVPNNAVVSYVGLTKVFVLENNRAAERSVKLAARSDGWVEVVEGLRPGELVITSNLSKMRDGRPVDAQ